MKKIFLIITVIVLSIMVCACEKKEDVVDSSEEVTFSGDDLAVFSTQSMGKLIANLYMNEADIPYGDEEVGNALNSFNIGLADVNGEKNINYLYFYGNEIPVQTVKGIYTTGIDFLDEELCSDEADVIKNYGLNTDEEEIYFKTSENSDSSFIAVYFNVDKDGNVVRVKQPKGTDISKFDAIDANAYIYFEVKNNKVVGIIMRHK